MPRRVAPAAAAAIQAWEEALGSEHVVTAKDDLDAASRATFATTQEVVAIIRPSSLEEVQTSVRIANEHKTAVYPVSTGKNWGFGSRVPVETGCVLMELCRMRRIREYDEDLAYVTVEPGVTFRQLHEFLRDRGSGLMVPFTGSSPETSLIGNALERGVGSGGYGYRVQHSCALEVVLASGQCVRSGLAGFADAPAGAVYRGGPGPEIDGMFVQSNLGIVTAMTVWLAPAPEHLQLCYAAVDHEDRLGDVVDAVRRLLLRGFIRPVVTFRNDYFLLLARQQQYPWEALEGETPFPRELLERMNHLKGREAWWSPRWAAFIYLEAGSSAHAEAQRDVIARGLGESADRVVFMSDEDVFVSRWTDDVDLDMVASSFDGVRPSRGLLTDPGVGNISLVYWRKRSAAPDAMDPDRDGCGAIFCAPLVPLTGSHVAACTSLVAKVMLQYGFEPAMSMFAISERCAYVAAMLIFDRDVEGEDERALACHEKMVAQLLDRGYVSHRVAIHGMGTLRELNSRYSEFLDVVKHALDPNNILAPGRYGL